jgi:hypothetical protein
MRVENLKQTRFGAWPVTRRSPKPAAVRSAKEGHDLANLESACIIASNPVAYPEGSLMAEWADMILSRAADADEAKAMPLFRTAA